MCIFLKIFVKIGYNFFYDVIFIIYTYLTSKSYQANEVSQYYLFI